MLNSEIGSFPFGLPALCELVEEKTISLDKDIALFLFPNYPPLELSSYRPLKKFIFFSNELEVPKEIMRIRETSRCILVLRSFADIDLNNRENILNFVYAKHSKTPPKKTVELKHLSQVDFLSIIKQIWIIGNYSYVEEELKVFELYSAYLNSLSDFIKVFYEMKMIIPYSVFESLVLSFFLKAETFSDSDYGLSYAYSILLKRLKRLLQEVKVKSLLSDYSRSKKRNYDQFLGVMLKVRDMI